MPLFDPSSFVSDVGKSISGVASSATGIASQGVNSLNNALASSGLSLDGIKNFATSKLDSLSSLGSSFSQEFNRMATNSLFSSRSEGSATDNDPSSAIGKDIWSAPLQYPLDNLRTEFLTIDFAKYNRPSNFDKGAFSSVLKVHLPIPRSLTEQHTIDVAPQKLKTLGAATGIIENAINTARGRSSSYETITEDAIGFAASAASQMGESAKGAFGFSGEQITGTIQQYAGAIPNPHISVFFNGVDLRPAIEFSWLFTPRTVDDSMALKEILKQVKSLVLPAISKGNGNIMDYPHMVKIDIQGLDKDTTPMYKRGLITAININYTPNGPSFFKGTNAPTFVAFSFLFQEIEIITANDYGAEAASGAEMLKNMVKETKAAVSDIGSNIFGGNN
jgi:hypothetical protein